MLNPEHQGLAKERQLCALLLSTGSGSVWDAEGVVTTASFWCSSVPWSDIGSWGWRVTANLILMGRGCKIEKEPLPQPM